MSGFAVLRETPPVCLPENAVSTPLVSVIVPSFNYARYLPEVPDCVLGQTFTAADVVINDVSLLVMPGLETSRFENHVPRVMRRHAVECDRNTGGWWPGKTDPQRLRSVAPRAAQSRVSRTPQPGMQAVTTTPRDVFRTNKTPTVSPAGMEKRRA